MFDTLIWVLELLGWTCYHRSLFCERWRSYSGVVRLRLDYSTGTVHDIS
jgi:hypothetical protein